MTGPVFYEPPVDQPVFDDHVEFFREFLADRFARDLSKTRWCPSWRDHLEANFVVESLWRSFEDCTRDRGQGSARWLVEYAYPLLRQLWDDGGTFAGCEDGEHNPRSVQLPTNAE